MTLGANLTNVILTILPQFNGNKYMMCVTSKNSKTQVTMKLNMVTNIINRILLRNGNKNKLSLTVPEVHKHNKHINEVICEKIHSIRFQS